ERGELAADDAAADDQQALRHPLQAKDAVRGHHAGVVHVDPGQPECLGADADDEMVVLEALPVDDDGVTLDHALPAHDVHLLPLAGRLHAAAHGEDDLLLALHHAGEVDAHVADLDAELLGAADLAQQVGGGQQRLGGDAPPVEAGAAQLGALDEGHLGAELGAAQRGHVAGGTAAEDDDARAHASLLGGDSTISPGRSYGCSALRSAVVRMRSCSIWCAPVNPSL